MDTWLQVIALGAVLGAIGQAARGIVGWKKVFDEARSLHTTAAEIFSPSRLAVSMIVGAVAGVLAALTLVDDPAKFQAEQTAEQFKQFLLALVATGYAGADFIEGFVRNRYSGPPAHEPDTRGAKGDKPTGGRSTSNVRAAEIIEPDDDRYAAEPKAWG